MSFLAKFWLLVIGRCVYTIDIQQIENMLPWLHFLYIVRSWSEHRKILQCVKGSWALKAAAMVFLLYGNSEHVLNEKWVFSKENNNQICDCCWSNKCPEPDQITKISPIRAHLFPNNHLLYVPWLHLAPNYVRRSTWIHSVYFFSSLYLSCAFISFLMIRFFITNWR